MNTAPDFFLTRFAELGTPERAVSERAYMKSALRFHGVTMTQVRAACADFCRAKPDLDHDALVAAINTLYATDWFDLHSAAIGVLERRAKLVGPDDAAWLITLVRRSACWAHVDWLATTIIPRALPTKPDGLLRSWARDGDFWVKRTALLAELPVLRAGGGDFTRFCALAEPMLGEKEFFIRKAIGWVLREVSKKRPELVFAFVERHRDRMSGLTFREATRRLPAAMRDALG